MEQGKGLKQGKFFFAIFLFLLFIMDMAANLMGSDIEDDALQDSGGGEHSKASGGGESSTSRSFYRPQFLQVFTSYKDVIPESEEKGGIITALLAALNGVEFWTEDSLKLALGPILKATERFQEADIAKLTLITSFKTLAYDTLILAAQQDNLVKQYLAMILSSQNYDSSISLLWILAVLNGLLIGNSPFEKSCLGLPRTQPILEGRLEKMGLGFAALALEIKPSLQQTSQQADLREIIQTNGISLAEIDRLQSVLKLENFKALQGRDFQMIGDAAANDVTGLLRLDGMGQKLAIDAFSASGIILSRKDGKHILALRITMPLLCKMSGGASSLMDFASIFKIVQILELANSIAKIELYPEAFRMLAEFEGLVSATASINGISADWKQIFEQILGPHIISFTQQRSLSLQNGHKAFTSMHIIPTRLQMLFGPLMAKARQEKKAARLSTGVCFDFQNGSCSRGDSCRFEHRMEAVKRVKAVCRDFLKGTCTRGKDCRFAHEVLANSGNGKP